MVAEGVSGALDVGHPHTRAIEDRSIIRGFVRSAEVVDGVDVRWRWGASGLGLDPPIGIRTEDH